LDAHKAQEDSSEGPSEEPLSLSGEAFAVLMERLPHAFLQNSDMAVAVSGGPDSMALAFLLSLWAAAQSFPPTIHALIVDHGLRPESAQEAQTVKETLSKYAGLHPVILTWVHKPLTQRIQEEARTARYTLMTEYCAAKNITALFLGHHQDDQAETFLFRLAKGSGLDGLCAMRPVQRHTETLSLIRPFLDIPKARLIETCRIHAIPVVQDPSNTMGKFARIRLRQARAILEEEGLTSRRLSTTAKRLERARRALEDISEKTYETLTKKTDTNRIVFIFSAFHTLPEEISLRCLMRAIKTLAPHTTYPPRLEKCETLHADLVKESPFRKRSFAGLIFERRDAQDEIVITHEKSPQNILTEI